MGKINDLKDQALATLRGKWGSFIGLTFIFILLYGIVQFLAQCGTIFQGSSFTTLAVVFLIIGAILGLLMLPMQYGYYVAYLNSSRQDLPADIGDLFCGYKRFGHVIGTLLLMSIVICAVALPCIMVAVMMGIAFEKSSVSFAWLICLMVLLMIPVFIFSLAYSMVPYLLHDDKELFAGDILRKSRMMMRGHKWELFLLELSFIGWMLLGVLTLFIGYLWLIPYMQMTVTKFYEQLRAEYEGIADEEDDSAEEETVAVD
jgi:uncharacterized membrane protein